mmetsp:Transcript_23020/g.71700  ORF Transcript_23020/g.71700 Transcript_23020/m.71700 type:complete len:257 (-) Transcript_23020:65-835(-)
MQGAARSSQHPHLALAGLQSGLRSVKALLRTPEPRDDVGQLGVALCQARLRVPQLALQSHLAGVLRGLHRPRMAEVPGVVLANLREPRQLRPESRPFPAQPALVRLLGVLQLVLQLGVAPLQGPALVTLLLQAALDGQRPVAVKLRGAPDMPELLPHELDVVAEESALAAPVVQLPVELMAAVRLVAETLLQRPQGRRLVLVESLHGVALPLPVLQLGLQLLHLEHHVLIVVVLLVLGFGLLVQGSPPPVSLVAAP